MTVTVMRNCDRRVADVDRRVSDDVCVRSFEMTVSACVRATRCPIGGCVYVRDVRCSWCLHSSASPTQSRIRLQATAACDVVFS